MTWVTSRECIFVHLCRDECSMDFSCALDGSPESGEHLVSRIKPRAPMHGIGAVVYTYVVFVNILPM